MIMIVVVMIMITIMIDNNSPNDNNSSSNNNTINNDNKHDNNEKVGTPVGAAVSEAGCDYELAARAVGIDMVEKPLRELPKPLRALGNKGAFPFSGNRTSKSPPAAQGEKQECSCHDDPNRLQQGAAYKADMRVRPACPRAWQENALAALPRQRNAPTGWPLILNNSGIANNAHDSNTNNGNTNSSIHAMIINLMFVTFCRR